MSNQFLKLRRSAVPGKIPDTGSLALGEIALNTYDGLAFMKKSGSNGEEVVVIGNTTGSFSGNFTGSLFGTSSWAYNASTASTADNFFVRGDITGSNALFTGTLTAQTLVVQTITSSVIYSSGSNIFGNKLTDSQELTGSVTVTGSLALNGDPVVTEIPYNAFSSSIQYRTTNLENTASVLTSASASFAQDSGSNSLRLGNLESTASILTTASASFAVVSSSYSSASESLSNRVINLESTASVLTTASASFALVSSSYSHFSQSYNTGSFTGSFFGNGSGLTNISASSVVGLNLSLIGSGSVTASTDPAYGFKVNSNTEISGSTQITGSLGITGSFSLSGSVGNLFTANVDTLIFTGSFYQLGSSYITGSLSVFQGITGSLHGTSSWSVNALTASSINFDVFQIKTGSVSAKVDIDSNNLFLIKSGSTQYLNISSSGDTTFHSDLFIVRSFTTNNPILTVSQSIVQFATNSLAPSNPASNGNFWFTATDLYIGLD